MTFDQNLFTFTHQTLPRRSMQVKIDPILFLSQPILSLLHVLGHTVVSDELLRFRFVVRLGRE